MTIKLDSTRHSVVVLCTDCAWRRVVTGGEADGTGRALGWQAGAQHEQQAHGGAGNASGALYAAKRRAAGTG